MHTVTIQQFEQEIRQGLTELYTPSEIREITYQLLEEVLRCNRTQLLLLGKDRELSTIELTTLRAFQAKLATGLPLQYLLGYVYFAGHRIQIREGALIPRPETEELVGLIGSDPASRGFRRLLDIGTGSGCIAYALTANLPVATESFAIEVSSAAIPIAEANFEVLAEQSGRRVQLWKKDLFELVSEATPPAEPFDLIVSNPPYIHPDEAEEMAPNVLLFEPHLALFAPESAPIAYYVGIGRLVQQGYLAPNGHLWLELNPRYAEETRTALLQLFDQGEVRATLIPDLSGKQRFLHLIYRPSDASEKDL